MSRLYRLDEDELMDAVSEYLQKKYPTEIPDKFQITATLSRRRKELTVEIKEIK